jgi:hypothetical protein
MPAMTGLLRRRGQPSSDPDTRRHTIYAADSTSTPSLPHIESRASEQIPRRSDFLSPSSGAPVITRTSADNLTRLEEHAGSPVKQQHQEDNTSTKPRRFSMIRSRHASDSHLSTKARLQAQADAPAVPHRVYPYSPSSPAPSESALTLIFQLLRS